MQCGLKWLTVVIQLKPGCFVTMLINICLIISSLIGHHSKMSYLSRISAFSSSLKRLHSKLTQTYFFTEVSKSSSVIFLWTSLGPKFLVGLSPQVSKHWEGVGPAPWDMLGCGRIGAQPQEPALASSLHLSTSTILTANWDAIPITAPWGQFGSSPRNPSHSSIPAC